jgi:hypothetical protein
MRAADLPRRIEVGSACVDQDAGQFCMQQPKMTRAKYDLSK